jgi:hypothetical protein
VHPVAKRCLWSAAAALVAGSLLVAQTVSINNWLSSIFGHETNEGAAVLNAVIDIARLTLNPLAGSLIAAAIVIQVLAPREELRRRDSDVDDEVSESESGGQSI